MVLALHMSQYMAYNTTTQDVLSRGQALLIEHVQVHETLVLIAVHVALVLHSRALQVVHGNGTRIAIVALELESHRLIGQCGIEVEGLLRVGGDGQVKATVVREITIEREHGEVLNDERRTEVDAHECRVECVGDVGHEQDALRALIHTRDGQLLRHIAVTELRADISRGEGLYTSAIGHLHGVSKA